MVVQVHTLPFDGSFVRLTQTHSSSSTSKHISGKQSPSPSAFAEMIQVTFYGYDVSSVATNTRLRFIQCLDNVQIYFLFIVETVNSGFAIAMMYEPLVLRYGKVSTSPIMFFLFRTSPLGTLAATTYFPLGMLGAHSTVSRLSLRIAALSADPVMTVT